MDFPLFQLVELVGDHHKGTTGILKPARHGHVISRGRVPRIHDQDSQRDQSRSEIVFHELCPAGFFRLGNLGIAITGQIHQISGIVHQEIVDVNGLSGAVPHIGHFLPLQHPVDDRGFSDVGFPGKGNLWDPVPGELRRISG